MPSVAVFGQVLVAAVLFLAVCGTSFAGLVIDTGLLLAMRTRAQAVADSAALSAAWAFHNGFPSFQAYYAGQAVDANLDGLGTVTLVEVTPGEHPRVTVQVEASPFFAGFLGFDVLSVQASAEAMGEALGPPEDEVFRLRLTQ